MTQPAQSALRGASLLLVSLLLAGCATLGLPRPPTPPLLAPAVLGEVRSASQTLDVAYADRNLSLQCALQVDGQTLTLIAIGPLGRRALTLHYDGKEIAAQSDGEVPRQFTPERMLADLELMLWPVSAWQEKFIGSDWQLSEPRPGVRRLRWRGRLVAEVHYETPEADGWSGVVSLANLAYGYTLDLRTSSR
jgi:hypothetical protein